MIVFFSRGCELGIYHNFITNQTTKKTHGISQKLSFGSTFYLWFQSPPGWHVVKFLKIGNLYNINPTHLPRASCQHPATELGRDPSFWRKNRFCWGDFLEKCQWSLYRRSATSSWSLSYSKHESRQGSSHTFQVPVDGKRCKSRRNTKIGVSFNHLQSILLAKI